MHCAFTPELFWSIPSLAAFPILELVSFVSQHTVADIRTVLLFSPSTIVAQCCHAHYPLMVLNLDPIPIPICFYYHLPTSTQHTQEWMLPHHSLMNFTHTMGFRCTCRQHYPHFHSAQADVVKATIERESKQQAADAAAYEVEADARAHQEASQRKTDAHAYQTKIAADADAAASYAKVTKSTDAAAYQTRNDAEAFSYATQQRAEAELVAKLREAEGISAMADAYGKLSNAFGGPAGLLQYMMIEKGTYVELAKANAAAIRGLEPKISVWNTGSAQGGQGADPTETMRNVYQMLPPLMSTINEQTGITLPEWQFGKMSAGVDAVNQEGAKVNGHKGH